MQAFAALALALIVGQAEPTQAPDSGESPAPGETAPKSEAPSPAAAEPPAPPPPARERPPPPARPAEPERKQVARAALAFLDALLSFDPAGLAAASAEPFSFDGDVRAGKDEIRRTWRELFSGREGTLPPVLLDLEILAVPEAIERLGPPPARLGPLVAQKGNWVAIANVSRRPVVLFLSREGGRWAVVGME